MSNDPFGELIALVSRCLDDAGIEYAITGPMISSLYGEPFTSQDVDIVVRMNESQARRLARDLPQRFYRSEDALIEIARHPGLAILIDTQTQIKVDLSTMGPGDFPEAVFSRKRRERLGSRPPEFWAVSPEDIILMKLDWRRDTKSSKQWDNALSVVRVRGSSLDWSYLWSQARHLDLEHDLQELRDQSGI